MGGGKESFQKVGGVKWNCPRAGGPWSGGEKKSTANQKTSEKKRKAGFAERGGRGKKRAIAKTPLERKKVGAIRVKRF